MKKIIITSLLTIASIFAIGQANTYFHDRVDTTIFAIADTVGHGPNNYVVTNTSPDFNVKQYVNGLAINAFIKHGNTGSATLRLITRTGTLSARTIEKAGGAQLVNGDIKDSTLVLFTFCYTRFRVDVSPAMSPAWQLLGNAGTVDGTNFLGTTDNTPLSFRVNNIVAGRLDASTGNTYFGPSSALSNPSGVANTFIGYHTNDQTTTGFSNTSIGYDAGSKNVSGAYNVHVGYKAGFNSTTGDHNITIGDNVDVANLTGDKQLNIANSFYGKSINNANTASFAINTNTINATFQIQSANTNSTSATYNQLNFNGGSTPLQIFGVRNDGYIYSGLSNGNLTIGLNSGYANTSNTFVGVGIAQNITTTDGSTAFGYLAFHNATGANDCASFGRVCMYNNTNGVDNNGFGDGALFSNQTGSRNCAFGRDALNATLGNYNTGIGHLVAHQNNGAENTFLGGACFLGSLTGDDNVAVGYLAGYTQTTGNGNIAIGAITTFPSTTNSNQLNIGNAVYGDLSNKFLAVGGNVIPDKALEVNGDITIVGGTLYMKDSITPFHYWQGTMTSGVLVWSDTGSATKP